MDPLSWAQLNKNPQFAMYLLSISLYVAIATIYIQHLIGALGAPVTTIEHGMFYLFI